MARCMERNCWNFVVAFSLGLATFVSAGHSTRGVQKGRTVTKRKVVDAKGLFLRDSNGKTVSIFGFPVLGKGGLHFMGETHQLVLVMEDDSPRIYMSEKATASAIDLQFAPGNFPRFLVSRKAHVGIDLGVYLEQTPAAEIGWEQAKVREGNARWPRIHASNPNTSILVIRTGERLLVAT